MWKAENNWQNTFVIYKPEDSIQNNKGLLACLSFGHKIET